MSVVDGTVYLSELDPEDQVLRRDVYIKVNGKDLDVIDAMNEPAKFPCQPADTVVVQAIDLNGYGESKSSPVWSGKVVPTHPIPQGPMTPAPAPHKNPPGFSGAPGQPEILRVTFGF